MTPGLPSLNLRPVSFAVIALVVIFLAPLLFAMLGSQLKHLQLAVERAVYPVLAFAIAISIGICILGGPTGVRLVGKLWQGAVRAVIGLILFICEAVAAGIRARRP